MLVGSFEVNIVIQIILQGYWDHFRGATKKSLIYQLLQLTGGSTLVLHSIVHKPAHGTPGLYNSSQARVSWRACLSLLATQKEIVLFMS